MTQERESVREGAYVLRALSFSSCSTLSKYYNEVESCLIVRCLLVSYGIQSALWTWSYSYHWSIPSSLIGILSTTLPLRLAAGGEWHPPRTAKRARDRCWARRPEGWRLEYSVMQWNVCGGERG